MTTTIEHATLTPGPLHPIPWGHAVAPDHSAWTAARPGVHVRDVRLSGGATTRQTGPGPVGSCEATARCPQCRLAAAVLQQQAETPAGVSSRCAIAAYIPADAGAPIPIVAAATNGGDNVELTVLELMRHERGRLRSRLAELVATFPVDAVTVTVYSAPGAPAGVGESAAAAAAEAFRAHRCGCDAPAEHVKIRRRGSGRLHRAALLAVDRTVRPRLVASVAAAAELRPGGPMSGATLVERPYAAAAALALADLDTPWQHHRVLAGKGHGHA